MEAGRGARATPTWVVSSYMTQRQKREHCGKWSLSTRLLRGLLGSLLFEPPPSRWIVYPCTNARGGTWKESHDHHHEGRSAVSHFENHQQAGGGGSRVLTCTRSGRRSLTEPFKRRLCLAVEDPAEGVLRLLAQARQVELGQALVPPRQLAQLVLHLRLVEQERTGKNQSQREMGVKCERTGGHVNLKWHLGGDQTLAWDESSRGPHNNGHTPC
jgi:hypothetical protein